jgi:Na+/phosphate symporter
MFKSLFRIMKFIFALYIFIFAIELIKKSSLLFAGNLSSILLIIKNSLNSLGVGWLATVVMQSSSVFIATIATFV